MDFQTLGYCDIVCKRKAFEHVGLIKKNILQNFGEKLGKIFSFQDVVRFSNYFLTLFHLLLQNLRVLAFIASLLEKYQCFKSLPELILL
jgi:hypothetical protein